MSSRERYPADTQIEIDDVLTCGWQAALAAAETSDYSALSSSLRRAAQSASEEARFRAAKALWLLSDAASMMLKGDRPSRPFEPFAVIQNRRSAMPEDFAIADLQAMVGALPHIENLRLRARIADLAWFRSRRDFGFQTVLLAIDAYLALPVTAETWHLDIDDCIERAASLSRMLRNDERIAEVERVLTTAFFNDAGAEGFFVLQVGRLLLRQNLARTRSRDFAQKLQTIGEERIGAGEQFAGRQHLEQASDWYRRDGDREAMAEMLCKVADSWAAEGLAKSEAPAAGNIVALDHFHKALEIFRLIDGRWRPNLGIEEKIRSLDSRIAEAGRRALGEMTVHRSPPVHIGDIQDECRRLVSDQPIARALIRLVTTVHSGADFKRIRASAEARMRRFLFSSLAAGMQLNREGRVVAVHPPATFGEVTPGRYDPALWAKMVGDYQQEIDIVVRAQIFPAIETLQLEHRLGLESFADLARQSPLVAQDRRGLFAKGLYAGFEGDFDTALHLLVPQLEHIVRERLRRHSVITSSRDADGVETENGLSRLVRSAEMPELFGEDLSFELEALFCDATGPNLRNEVAHGLLNDYAANSGYAVYAWWLVLRLVLTSILDSEEIPAADPRPEPINPAPHTTGEKG